MLTTRQLDEVRGRRSTRFASRLAEMVAPILRFAVKTIPGLGSLVTGTFAGRVGELGRLMSKQQCPEVFRGAVQGLVDCESQRSRLDLFEVYWWTFLEIAARSANRLGDAEQGQVIAALTRAPAPGGLYEALCLDFFSRWRWSAADPDGAIDLARRAVLADATRPEGHILLGWYGLMTGRFDPLPRLREAVRVSPGALEHIRENSDFARFPELINALSESPLGTETYPKNNKPP